MSQSIKISTEVMSELRSAAALTSRSLAGQAEHWMRIGRAIERSPQFSYQRVEQALRGLSAPAELSLEEQEVHVDAFADALWSPSEREEAFFAERRQRGLGVGLDEDGTIQRQEPEQG